MSHDLPDDWYEDHDGQRLVLNSEKVASEIERLHQRVAVLEMVIFEELTDCDDAANQMIVDGIRAARSPALPSTPCGGARE